MYDRTRDDLDDLLHPAQAFGHPSEVLNDPDLSLNEKRAILASWASDACAIEVHGHRYRGVVHRRHRFRRQGAGGQNNPGALAQ
jgi:hypothetical protein